MIDYRDRAIELVEDCIIEDFEVLAKMCLKYMSQDDVKDMLECNEMPEPCDFDQDPSFAEDL